MVLGIWKNQNQRTLGSKYFKPLRELLVFKTQPPNFSKFFYFKNIANYKPKVNTMKIIFFKLGSWVGVSQFDFHQLHAYGSPSKNQQKTYSRLKKDFDALLKQV